MKPTFSTILDIAGKPRTSSLVSFGSSGCCLCWLREGLMTINDHMFSAVRIIRQRRRLTLRCYLDRGFRMPNPAGRIPLNRYRRGHQCYFNLDGSSFRWMAAPRQVDPARIKNFIVELPVSPVADARAPRGVLICALGLFESGCITSKTSGAKSFSDQEGP